MSCERMTNDNGGWHRSAGPRYFLQVNADYRAASRASFEGNSFGREIANAIG